MIYRVEVTGSGELLSNPIFVEPILEPKAVNSQPPAFGSGSRLTPKPRSES
jgi:hypothetical protein